MMGKVVIIGGSIAGLLAGNMFHRMGWEVDVFERVEGALEGRGAGITILPGLPEAFRAAGVTENRLGIELPMRRVIDGEGRVLAERDFSQPMTSWTRLFELLKAAFPLARYHKGVSLTRFEQRDRKVAAHFADGTSIEADLLIGADGLRSGVRAQMLPEAKPLYAGYIAWRALVDETALSQTAREALIDRYTICAAPGEQGIAYTVPGPNYALDFGKRQVNVVWYHPVREADLRPLFTDDSRRYHPNGIPPSLLSAKVRDDMIAIAQKTLAPSFAEAIRLSSIHFFQPIFDLEPACMTEGRVAIIGDAAFIIRPHTAMGVGKAGGDAMALAGAVQACGGDHLAGLRAFEAARMLTGRAILERGKYLGTYMEAQLKSEDERRRAETMRTPEYSLETAMPADYR
jgi:2-polyprenyl-6-methoxyphenol hydroxylase-like FAD-dependent oxidoreductase